MRKFTHAFTALAALAALGACSDTTMPSSPRPQLDALGLGNPPPPQIEATGNLDFGVEGAAPNGAAASVASVAAPSDCNTTVAFVLQGGYFNNNTSNNAYIDFSPVNGQGHGTIHQHAGDAADPVTGLVTLPADGTLIGTDLFSGQRVMFHLVSYTGTPITRPALGDSFGFTSGTLTATVGKCKTTTTGFLTMSWGISDNPGVVTNGL